MTTAYQDAILNNAHIFKDKTVMDIGAGNGILSLSVSLAQPNLPAQLSKTQTKLRPRLLLRLI